MYLLRLLLTLLAVQPSLAPAFAPENTVPETEEVLSCGTDQVHNALRKSDPDYALKMDALEAEWAQRRPEDQTKSAAAPPYVLPIVFHIVHENGAENIPDSDIFRSVDFLNQALENTDYYDPATGVNTQIQVCMARRSPDNEATNGINRIVSPLTNLNTNDDRDLKDLSRWAPRDYINVWVVKEACGIGLGCGLAGYAYYPGAHGSSIDGIVLEARWLADDEADLSVLVHELGHYLGVRHTFEGGCENDDCVTDGDRVCDTPPDQSTVAIPCTGSANSCSTDTNSGPFTTDQDDMHINYMDYGYFRCYSAFTAGQRERMHFFLEGTRSSLLESKGCKEPCPAVITASFTGGDVTIQAGETINFVNTSTNGARYEWYRGSTLISTEENPTFSFDEDGFFRIRLIVFPADTALCKSVEISQRVRVTCSVDASFDLPSPAPQVDSMVVFTNTSSGADESEWTVDGSVFGSDRDLNYVFTSSGRFLVCLTESVGFCEAERCVNVFVRMPVTDPDPPVDTIGCDGRFSYSYSLPDNGFDGAFNSVVVRGDTIFTLATQEERAFAMALTADGTILWQTELFPSGTAVFAQRLMLDGEGMLAGFGTMTSQGSRRPFAFRVNTMDGSFIWAKEFILEFTNFQFTAIVDQPGKDEYIIAGHLSGGSGLSPSFQLFVNRSDGNAAAPAVQLDHSLFMVQDMVKTNAASDDFAMVGPIANASSQGIGLARTDGSGNVLSLAVVTSQTFPGFLVTFQSALLVSDGDSLVIGSFYENPTSGISILRICKTDGDGVSGWTKDYELPANSARLVSIRRNEAGYLVLLQLGLNASLLQTNSVGEVLWSYLYDGLESIVSGTDALQVENDHILIAAARFRGGQAVPTVVRLSKDGSQLSSCNTGIALGITDTTEISSFTPFQVSTIGMELGLSDFFAEPSNFILVDELSCRENCPEEENDCNPAFLRTYGPTVIAPNLARYEVNHHVDNGANVIIAGRNDARNPFVAALGPDGDVRWAKSIFIDRAGTVSDMIIDAEGMVCGTGTFGLSANGGLNTYTFRIDPATGNLLWLKGHTLAGRSFALSQLHHTPGDDFLRATGYHEVGLTSISKGILARINLTTGEFMALPTSYSDLGETSFRAFGKHPSSDTYYALANIQQSSAGTPQLARLNADGSVIFNKQYDQPEIGQAIGMVVKDATVTMLCESNSGGFVLVQTDTDGNWRWQKNYGDGNQVHGITALPDGFMVWITSSSGNSNAFIRLDDAGSIVWANRIVGTFNFGLEDVFHVSTSTTAMTISTINGFNSFEAPSRIIRSDLSGAFGFDCMPNGTPIEVLITTAQTIVADVPLQLQLEFDPFSRNLESGEANLELKENCQGDCIEQPEPVERCGNGLDDDGDGLLDCDDPDLSDNCCCLDPPITDFGEDQAFCGMVEIQFTPPASWERVRLSGDASGEVLSFEPGLSYGFTFDEPGTYFFEAIDTCGNPGFDTLILTPYPPLTLDLGPDVTVCENATVNLIAQPGFESYEWIDGSTERTFTTFGEGDFSVIATDSCGEQYTDTVTVIFNPATIIELGIDTTICPGDTLTFRLEGFTDIQWSQSSFIDCFDCAEIRFAPTMDTLLLVAAKQGPGCFSSDSLRVRIKPLAGARDTTTLCEGDSFSFGGQTVSGAGQYYDFLDDSNCPVVDTLDVFGLRDTLVSEVMNICAGDSVLVFGAFEREANTYLRISTSSNGCDSTNQVILTVNQIVVTAETVSICGGDSALVFGVFERDPDVYFRISTGQNGCDSTHQITLEVNDISATAVQVRPGCGGAAAGASQVFFESNGQPVSIRWSDNTATALNENLASGDYTVTVTTEDGCSATAEVTISNAPPTNIAPATEPESCPGENDGTITIPTAPPGFTYQLNGGPEQTNPQFQNLAPGPYQLTARDTFGCPQTYDLTVSTANNLVFELPPDITINFGDSVVLDPTTLFPAEATINWLTDNGTGCPSCPTFTLRPQENVAVTATATDSSGCSQTRTTRITVSKDELFYVPNAFSPNGDGVNDIFRVYPGPAVERILSFAVFDRWGGRVFLREDFDAEDTLGGWDGLLAGRQNPAIGVYVYLVEVRLFSGKVVSGSGEILVMR